MKEYKKVNFDNLNIEFHNTNISIEGIIIKVNVPRVSGNTLYYLCDWCGEIHSRVVKEGETLVSPIKCPFCNNTKVTLIEEKIVQNLVQVLFLEDEKSSKTLKLLICHRNVCEGATLKNNKVIVCGQCVYDDDKVPYIIVDEIQLI